MVQDEGKARLWAATRRERLERSTAASRARRHAVQPRMVCRLACHALSSRLRTMPLSSTTPPSGA